MSTAGMEPRGWRRVGTAVTPALCFWYLQHVGDLLQATGKTLGVVLLRFWGFFVLDLGQLVAVKPLNKAFFGRLAGLHKAGSEIADTQPSLRATAKPRPDASGTEKKINRGQ